MKRQKARERQQERARRTQLRALMAEQQQEREVDWKLTRARRVSEKRSRYKDEA